jgi:Alpha/beta hydrolase domain
MGIQFPMRPRPAVSGITGGTHGLPFTAMPAGMAEEHGYTEREYLVSGEATAYAPAGALGPDGAWAVAPAARAPYATRILVRRPEDTARFDGTVWVEWLNVSTGMDADPDFGLAHDLILRGSAWVGVSAQRTGVEGGPALPVDFGIAVEPLKAWDPARYRALTHPGDPFSYDIFTQVAEALRRPGGLGPLGGLRPDRVLATGASQSAGRLVTYVNAVQPLAGVYDGFLVHSRGGGGEPLDGGWQPLGGGAARARTDLAAPVLQVVTETDLFGFLGFAAARQDDTAMARTWEVAGTAHADRAALAYAEASLRRWAGDAPLDLAMGCRTVNDGPHGAVLRAAMHALGAWVAGGPPPSHAPRLEVAGGAIARDERGIARGGVRTPPVDAPTAVLSGEPRPGANLLWALFGDTTPLGPAALRAAYPTHEAYVAAVEASAARARTGGFLLPADAAAMVAAARAAPEIGGLKPVGEGQASPG